MENNPFRVFFQQTESLTLLVFTYIYVDFIAYKGYKAEGQIIGHTH